MERRVSDQTPGGGRGRGGREGGVHQPGKRHMLCVGAETASGYGAYCRYTIDMSCHQVHPDITLVRPISAFGSRLVQTMSTRKGAKGLWGTVDRGRAVVSSPAPSHGLCHHVPCRAMLCCTGTVVSLPTSCVAWVPVVIGAGSALHWMMDSARQWQRHSYSWQTRVSL
jgi:hypothetical protein